MEGSGFRIFFRKKKYTPRNKENETILAFMAQMSQLQTSTVAIPF